MPQSGAQTTVLAHNQDTHLFKALLQLRVNNILYFVPTHAVV